MAMLIKVTVKDVNGAMLSFTRVNAIYTANDTPMELTAKEFTAGEVLIATFALPQLELQVSATDFESERFLFAEMSQTWQSDNPASTIAKQGGTLDITVTLGIARLAPTIALPPNDKFKDNPRAARVDDAGGGQWIYRGAWHNFETPRRLGEPIFGDLNGFEWSRFNNSIIMIELARHGRFVLLEYGPRLVPGKRIPRFSRGGVGAIQSAERHPGGHALLFTADT